MPQNMIPAGIGKNRGKNKNANSTPDFTGVPMKLPLSQDQFKSNKSKSNRGKNGSLGSNGALSGSGSNGSSGGYEQKISRKTAATYLSGLSKGYISHIDNIKLINNCLNSSQAAGFSNTYNGPGNTNRTTADGSY